VAAPDTDVLRIFRDEVSKNLDLTSGFLPNGDRQRLNAFRLAADEESQSPGKT
jgi:hypothetical protein